MPAAQIFEPQHFDTEYDRAFGVETNLQKLFKGVIGCEGIIAKLNGFLKVTKGMRAQGLEPRGQIPMNFIFKGPPDNRFFLFALCFEHSNPVHQRPGKRSQLENSVSFITILVFYLR